MYHVKGGSGRKPASQKVILNVYDLAPSTASSWAYAFGVGVHHSGVEIMGNEYGFYGSNPTGSGVMVTPPRTISPPAVFREAIEMGEIQMTSTDVKRVIEDLARDFPGDSYHITTRNCNVFSNALCMRLLGAPIPGWVNRLASIGGSWVKPLLEAASVAPSTATPLKSSSSSGAFSGEGYTLSSSSDSGSKEKKEKEKGKGSSLSPSSSSTGKLTSAIEVDDTAPKGIVFIRLPDGSKVECVLNHSHTVDHIRQYLDSAYPTDRPYRLYSTYPRTELTDVTMTLTEAGLVNSVIIQSLQ